MGVFLMVSAIGIPLIVWGFFALLYVIPRCTPQSRVSTEFLSARAALWCVAVGLLLVVLATAEVCLNGALRGWLHHQP